MLRLFGVLFIALIVLSVIAAYGYRNLHIEFSGVDAVQPAIRTDADSLAEATLHLISGDTGSAAEAMIEGIRISGDIYVTNLSLVPLYIPSAEHTISLNGRSLGHEIASPSGWLKADEARVETIDFLIPTEDLPAAVMSVLISGGELVLVVESGIEIGPFSVSQSSEFSTTVTDAIREALDG